MKLQKRLQRMYILQLQFCTELSFPNLKLHLQDQIQPSNCQLTEFQVVIKVSLFVVALFTCVHLHTVNILFKS